MPQNRNWTGTDPRQAEKSERKPTADANLSDAETSSNSPIYRSRHLQQSAAELGFDWPDIGPVFNKLEEELGVAIFERTSRSVSITPVGEQILAIGRQITEQVDAIEEL